MKRKHAEDTSDDDPLQTQELTPRKRTAPSTPKSKSTSQNTRAGEDTPAETPSRRLRSRAKPMPGPPETNPTLDSPTPKTKTKAKGLFTTPTKPKTPTRPANATPSRSKVADRSAKKKSATILADQTADGDWDGGDNLARQILDIEEGDGDEDAVNGDDDAGETATAANNTRTPRKGGRAKGSKNRRSPTPEGDIPPHERHFFQNRPGPAQTSNNTLAKLSMLTHEEYFEQLAKYIDPHVEARDYLVGLHERSFPQWRFELSGSFNVCLYGYGSKKQLVQRFADWLYEQSSNSTIVIVNGYTPNITIRSILATIIESALGADAPSKLGTQPSDVLELLQSILSTNPPPLPITVVINSIDAIPLRRPSHQALLARLANLPHINVLATADTPNFLLLWDVTLRDEFNFVFHDCTTFASYDAEIDVVDEVHSLFGRKSRRIGGRQGIGFVLKSLPENTRKLYRLLITEILTCLGDHNLSEDEDTAVRAERGDKSKSQDAAVEWRTLFNKASEEFISSSEMMFRIQLKEFYDHQMIVSKTDQSGGEMLGVPLSREEMEGILEELVLEQ